MLDKLKICKHTKKKKKYLQKSLNSLQGSRSIYERANFLIKLQGDDLQHTWELSLLKIDSSIEVSFI